MENEIYRWFEPFCKFRILNAGNAILCMFQRNVYCKSDTCPIVKNIMKVIKGEDSNYESDL